MSTYYHGSDFDGLEYEKVVVSGDNTDPLKLQSGPGFYVCNDTSKCRAYGINIYEVTLRKGFRLKKKRPTAKLIGEFLDAYFSDPYYGNRASNLYRDSSIRGIEHIYIEIFKAFVQGSGGTKNTVSPSQISFR